ncbi:HAT1-interacting factor 1 [Entomortierella parvispora]|uniref:HAT1-interacting factor 1 n=1 Tax=Entomortierella parvispora TaxID=205924 RepID=A0A9P3M0F2_9FUNG|nr:HAT1-interacting factor 1 [Entomortierella parvispora]
MEDQGSSLYQTEEEQQQQELFVYDGPIDPATESAIQELNDAGAKAFALQDYELAVEKFGLASEMMGQVYGETNPKCADVLFQYGKALLEHAIQQSSVLGGATEKKSQEELEAVVAAATGITPGSSSSSSAPSNPRFHFEGDDDDDEDEEEVDAEEGEQGGASSGAAEGGEEDQDDFAVAWDVLDLARVLYHRQGTEEALLKLGDVHIALGDVSLESENFEQAVADFKEALKIKEARLEAEDRELAEAHYKLALALEYSPTESEKAQEHIHKAATVLRARIDKLNGILASYGKGKGKASEASESENKMAKELLELHELVGEMDQKVQDLITNMNNKQPVEGQTHIAMLTEMLGQKKAQVVNDISGLIVKSKSSGSGAGSGSGSSSTANAAGSSAVTPKAEEEADDGKKRKAEEPAGEALKSEEDADKKVKL